LRDRYIIRRTAGSIYICRASAREDDVLIDIPVNTGLVISLLNKVACSEYSNAMHEILAQRSRSRLALYALRPAFCGKVPSDAFGLRQICERQLTEMSEKKLIDRGYPGFTACVLNILVALRCLESVRIKGWPRPPSRIRQYTRYQSVFCVQRSI
jgi:hypothetical protein